MAKKLFFGGLSWNTSEDGLRRACSKFGLVNDVKIIVDRESGRSLGFGFVEFDGEDDAAKAIAELNGGELEGRRIRVSLAQEKLRAPRDHASGCDSQFQGS